MGAMGRSALIDEPVLDFPNAAAWRAWLSRNHRQKGGVRLRIKKPAGKDSISYAEAVEQALAWGWIDGQKWALDAKHWLQRFTPRAAQSPWSKLNRKRAEALIASGEMAAPGLAEVERARRDGRWERAYDGAKTALVPEDLAAAFAKSARARAFFEKLDAANRYAILYRVQTAKKQETRADRIARFVGMCARGETIHPARAKKAKKGA